MVQKGAVAPHVIALDRDAPLEHESEVFGGAAGVEEEITFAVCFFPRVKGGQCRFRLRFGQAAEEGGVLQVPDVHGNLLKVISKMWF